MNVVEANPLISQADISTGRYQKRIELYRIRHEQNHRQYQQVWTEEARKQIEETKQLHKRWIELQAKRTVGKAKNDILSSGASAIKKPKRKLPLTPDNVPSVQGVTTNTHDRGLNISNNEFSKPINQQSHLHKMFNTDNAYAAFSQPSFVKDNTSVTALPSISSVRAAFHNHTEENGAFRSGLTSIPSTSQEACNYFPLNKSSNEKQNDQVVGDAGVDSLPFDDSKLEDGLCIKENQLADDEFYQFWHDIEQNPEITKDVLEVLQENEAGEDLDNFPSTYPIAPSSGRCFSDRTNVVQSETASENARAESSKISDSLETCAFEAEYDSAISSGGPNGSASISLHRNNFVEQSVIRSNPSAFFRNLSDSMRSSGSFDVNVTGSMSEAAEADSRNNLPSYHDATSGKLIQTSHQQPFVFSKPLITQSIAFNNQLNSNVNEHHDTFRHNYNSSHQSYNFHQQAIPVRNQANYTSPNVMAFTKKNSYLPDDTNGYLYDNSMFQNELNMSQFYNNNNNVRYAGFNAQQFQKINCYSDFMPDCFFDSNQRSYHQMQSSLVHLNQAQTTFQNQNLGNNYWVYSGNGTNNVTYHDHMVINSQIPSTSINYKNVSCPYPSMNSQMQALPHSSSNQQALCSSYTNMTNSSNNNATHSSSTNNMSMFPMMDNSHMLFDPSTSSLPETSTMDCLGISVDAELSIIEDIINGK